MRYRDITPEDVRTPGDEIYNQPSRRWMPIDNVDMGQPYKDLLRIKNRRYRRPIPEPVYRIKPLVWRQHRESYCWAHSHLGYFYAYPDGTWSGPTNFAHPQPQSTDFASAKLAAESYYRDRMLAGLEEVK